MLADNPRELAANFRRSLTAWQRAKELVGHIAVRNFGVELEGWLSQVEKELLPRDPAAALELAEAFVKSEDSFFNRADDSDGVIAEAIRTGCRFWLKAASRCEPPPEGWSVRLVALASVDEYGVRDDLYRHADDLLDETALRGLVGQAMAELTGVLTSHAAAGSGRLPVGAMRISKKLKLFAQALRDPDVHIGAVLACTPQPDAHQMETFVLEYLNRGRPADALKWLDRYGDQFETSHRRLRATALRELGRRAESASILQALFEKTLAVADLTNWMEALPADEQSQAAAAARGLVVNHDDPVLAAGVLVRIGDFALAEAALVAAPGKISGSNYPVLVPLAKALEAQERWAGATAVYRSLLDAILDRAYARAYSHAFEYWQRLEFIAARDADLSRLGLHVAYTADIRRQHARKVSFWAYVNGARQVESDAVTGDEREP
jgi:hypothetical protein